MSKNVRVTKDDFVWMVVTHHMKSGVKQVRDLWKNHTLYALYDDGTESVVESDEEINEAIKLGLDIGVEVGYLPKKTWWDDADKKLIDGYWYVKINDLKLQIWQH